jgi:hypothetical protein
MALGAAGCVAPRPAGEVAGAPNMIRTDLYLGLSEPDGAVVTDGEFRAFVTDVVTPRFPQGLTVLSGDGQWQDPRTGQVTREPCRMLILLHPAGPAADGAIEAIRTAYQRQFHQQSVLRADESQRVSF